MPIIVRDGAMLIVEGIHNCQLIEGTFNKLDVARGYSAIVWHNTRHGLDVTEVIVVPRKFRYVYHPRTAGDQDYGLANIKHVVFEVPFEIRQEDLSSLQNGYAEFRDERNRLSSSGGITLGDMTFCPTTSEWLLDEDDFGVRSTAIQIKISVGDGPLQDNLNEVVATRRFIDEQLCKFVDERLYTDVYYTVTNIFCAIIDELELRDMRDVGKC